jgi:arylsulfatase A-like enzyme
MATMRKSDAFVIGIWSAFLFGIVEGILLNASRAYPVILAPYKTSAQVLWIAPLLDIALFLLASMGITIFLSIFKRWIREIRLDILYGLFYFLGFFTVLNALKLIHPASAAALALGLAVVVARGIRRVASRLTINLRRNLFWVPLVILLLGVGVAAYDNVTEDLRYQRLAVPSEFKTNVLVIVMDTVRYDRFTAPKSEFLVPNITRLAKRGIRYENAWPTTSWSLPSHASILTGRYPDEHCADLPGLNLNIAYPTLSEFFSAQGFITGAFSGNSAWVTPEYLGRGFLRFNVYTIEDQLRRTSLGRIVNKMLEKLGINPAGLGKKAPQVNQEFLDFLEDYPNRPFFVLINYMDVNQAFHKEQLSHPFWVDEPPVEEVLQAYDESLTLLDSQIGDLFDELERRGILDKTLVILTSDHGESFGAGASHDHNPNGHGTSLYVEQMRVPLFVLHPTEEAWEDVNNQLVSLAQIPTTIVQYVGYDQSPFPGSPLPLIISQGKESKNPVSETEQGVRATLNYDENHLRSLLWDDWQYINNLHPPRGEELFNLYTDPYAQQNIARENSLVDQAQAALNKLMGDTCAQSSN